VRVAPAVRTLQGQLDRARPGRREVFPDGTIGDANHAAKGWPGSDHNPDGDDDVTAVDVHDSEQLDDGELYESLKEAGGRNPQLKYAINNGRIYSPSRGEREYNGLNAHADHCHVSVTQEHKLDTRAWFLPGITDDQEDDDVTPQDRAMLVRIEKKLDALAAKRRPDHKDVDPEKISLGDILTAVQKD
jgi:hypothetical protein